MGLFSMIGKLAPTVGSILGQLFSSVQANDQEAVVRCSFTGVRPGFSADFRRSGTKCVMYNMGEEDDVVSIDVPRKGALSPQTIAVKSGYNFDVTELFKDCAQNNVDTFGLTACTIDHGVSLGDSNATTSCVTLSASGYKIPADGKPYKVGSYLEVIVDGSTVIVGTRDSTKLPIVSISSLIAQGSSDLKASVFGIDAKGEYAVPIHVACTFERNDSVDVDVVVKLGDAGKIVDSALSHPLMSKTTPEEMALLRKAIVLNL